MKEAKEGQEMRFLPKIRARAGVLKEEHRMAVAANPRGPRPKRDYFAGNGNEISNSLSLVVALFLSFSGIEFCEVTL